MRADVKHDIICDGMGTGQSNKNDMRSRLPHSCAQRLWYITFHLAVRASEYSYVSQAHVVERILLQARNVWQLPVFVKQFFSVACRFRLGY